MAAGGMAYGFVFILQHLMLASEHVRVERGLAHHELIWLGAATAQHFGDQVLRQTFT